MSQTKEKQAYRWLLRQVKPARYWLVASMGLGLLSGILLLGQAALLADIIHQLVMEGKPVEVLTGRFFSALVLIILRGVCAWGREFCGFRAGVYVRVAIRQMILDKLRRLGPLVIAEKPAGSWSAIVVEQVEELQEFVARYLPQMVLAVMIPLIMLLVVFPQSWVVGIIFLGTAPLIPLFMIFVGMRAAEANRRNFRALSRLGGFFLDRLQGLETLRLFQRTGHAQEQLSRASEDFRVKTMQVLRLAFLSSTVLEFFASVSIALVAVFLGMSFLGHLTFGGEVSLYTGLFLLLLAPEFYQPLRELGTYYHAKAKAVGATEEILALLSREEPREHHGMKPMPSNTSMALEIEGLTVAAASPHSSVSEPPVSRPGAVLINQVSFVIEPGSRVGIIGSSGAGKTTLVNTLMGFWQFQGDIRMGGQSLKETQLSDWRCQIAWLGQHPLIIHGSVYDNIAFGRDVSRQQCLKALERAQGLDILEKLTDGIDSPLLEQGGNLSVGQAQRIALARALAVPVKLLILDEPTASLDPASETLVLDALEAIDRDCTVITITHRLNQLATMDRVLMLEQGQLVANGAPDQLVRSSSHYQSFIQSQSRNVEDASLDDPFEGHGYGRETTGQGEAQ